MTTTTTTIQPTVEHIYAAAAKAATGRFSVDWEYYQGRWQNECGTACCLYGGACLEAGLPVPVAGPPGDWSGQSVEHALLAGAMGRTNANDALAAVERIRLGEVTDVDRGQAVWWAAERGHAATVKLLKATGSDQARPKILDRVALHSRILIVACEPHDGAWCAYANVVPGKNHDLEQEDVVKFGSKLIEDYARVMFPQFADVKYHK